MRAVGMATALVMVSVLVGCHAKSRSQDIQGPPSTWKIPEKWSIGQGTHSGKPMFTRLNLGLEPFIGRPEFPCQIAIAVPLRNPTEEGLPTGEEAQLLNDIEDEIVRRFLTANESLFAGVVTTQGRREFVLYTSNADAARAKAVSLARDIPHHEIEFVVHDDPTWEKFKQLVPPA